MLKRQSSFFSSPKIFEEPENKISDLFDFLKFSKQANTSYMDARTKIEEPLI